MIPAGTRVLVHIDGQQLRGRVVHCTTERVATGQVAEWHHVALVEPGADKHGRRWVSVGERCLIRDDRTS